MERLPVQYFSDVLCVWAYVGQVRIDELILQHGPKISMEYHFVDVFGDISGRTTERWRERGGLAGYGKHVLEVVGRFDHVDAHPDIWTRNVPTSSMNCHLFLHAVQEAAGSKAMEKAAWAMRQAFFVRALDVSCRSLQLEIAEELGISREDVEKHLRTGLASARLSNDIRGAVDSGIKISPTITFDEGRQVLRGNVGYRVIDANVQELLKRGGNQHSWC
ncbi:MAG: disulfide bond formation protein DsbA [Myxococcales bacterium]|nr:disulfide bond formation protein DsbA [Myxococcales bacterium]